MNEEKQLELFPTLDFEFQIQDLERLVRELRSQNIRYAGVLHSFTNESYDEKVRKLAAFALKDRLNHHPHEKQ
jgi:hypothetical protein